ncbi:MAG TPA: hypothetical protein VL442_16115 [Mucilaginibacter sp.]|jgi:hypothetical protein|nr:hypothetical protein [Mucilaginibacter sp.]
MNSSSPLLEVLEELFHDDLFDPVEEELFKWFLFAYTGKGNGIKNLDARSLEVFKSKLDILLNAIHNWHQTKV